MSDFIQKADYANCISDNILDDITEVDDAKIDTCEDEAIEFMISFLNSRYDCDEIFSQTGADRHTLILKYAKDITIFNLYALTNIKKTPAFREKNYEAAKEWLEGVRSLQLNPRGLPLLSDDNAKDYVQFGSNPKRRNHI